MKVYDPRSGTIVESTNPALIARSLILGNEPRDTETEARAREMADFCDECIALHRSITYYKTRPESEPCDECGIKFMPCECGGVALLRGRDKIWHTGDCLMCGTRTEEYCPVRVSETDESGEAAKQELQNRDEALASTLLPDRRD